MARLRFAKTSRSGKGFYWSYGIFYCFAAKNSVAPFKSTDRYYDLSTLESRITVKKIVNRQSSIQIMSLQNRVNPFGEIFESESRGTFMGNRGVIHKNKKIVAPFKTKYWITCVLEYKNLRRQVMTENRWTELFFLDEATAFAAGHRPCAFCRNATYKHFKKLWLEANGKNYELSDDSIKNIDQILHGERINPKNEKILFTEILEQLPNGVFIQLDNAQECYLYFEKELLKWTPFGYSEIIKANSKTQVKVLTPKSIVTVFEKGYAPEIHISAKKLLKLV